MDTAEISEICIGDIYLIALLTVLVAGSWLAGRAHERHQSPYRLLFITNRWSRLRYKFGLRWFT